MRIVFVIYSLAEIGGAERVISLMANYWSAKGWEISIVDFQEGELFYQLDSKVKHISLNIKGKHPNVLKRLAYTFHNHLKIRKCLIKKNLI